jgi:hypothetical protein
MLGEGEGGGERRGVLGFERRDGGGRRVLVYMKDVCWVSEGEGEGCWEGVLVLKKK